MGCVNLFNCCLFFSANRFSRVITKLAEEEFKITGLSPTYAFALMIINENPGMPSKELANKLHMSPSTITRFVDKLIVKGFVKRDCIKKNSFVSPTEKGKKHQEVINVALENLNKLYSSKIVPKDIENVTKELARISDILEEK